MCLCMCVGVCLCVLNICMVFKFNALSPNGLICCMADLLIERKRQVIFEASVVYVCVCMWSILS